MKYYRLYEKIVGRSPLSYGLGSGRWNQRKTPIIYCSNSRSLCMMEHYSIKGFVVSKSSWELAELDIDYDIPMIEVHDLQTDWDKRPHSNETQKFGTLWAEAKDYLCLKIPSSRIPLSAYPEEHNLLINPLHPDFLKSISILKKEDILFNLNTP